MQITWLFGNGLDISLGLKTRYKDFYDYLLPNEAKFELSENIIFEKIKTDIKENREHLWVDYEKMLGKLLEDVNEEQIDKFIQDKIHLDLLLKDYLTYASNDFQISKDKSKSIIVNAILDITRDKKEVEREKISKLLKAYSNYNVVINAISFNYTNSLSLLWDNNQQSLKDFRFYTGIPDANHKVILNKAFYLHGTLNNGEMIIGVNDSSQLMNEKFQNDNRINLVLVKKMLLETAGQRNINKFVNIINNSNIICLFGLSIGETDKMYWEYIKKRLLSDNNAKLIIYEYSEEKESTHIVLNEMQLREVKNKFYKNSNATENEIEKINSNILVEIGHDLFKISK